MMAMTTKSSISAKARLLVMTLSSCIRPRCRKCASWRASRERAYHQGDSDERNRRRAGDRHAPHEGGPGGEAVQPLARVDDEQADGDENRSQAEAEGANQQ